MPAPDNQIAVAPLTGVLDLRSPPNELPAGAVRWRQNLQTIGEKTIIRGAGWEKFLSGANYNNSDFHDQLLYFTDTIRQPVTMLFKALSSRRVRALFAATQGTIAYFNQHSGNWRVLGSGFGGTPSTSAAAPRFGATKLGDYVLFSNDFEKPKYHVIEGPTPYLSDLPDLELIGVTRVGVMWSWKNRTWLADVERDGKREANLILSSDADNPISFDPAKVESVTGFKYLDTDERILGGRPAGNGFIVYTTEGMWEITAVGGDQQFAFRQAYVAKENKGKGVLFYPNTLIDITAGHLYMGEDGIYLYNQFYNQPERIEWLHRSTAAIYDQIDKANCAVHVAGVRGDEVLFSIAQTGSANACPNITLRVNMAYRVADIIDAGFTAFENDQSQDVPTIRDFIIENRICTLDDLIDAGYGYGDEGLPRPLPVGTASFAPQSIYTNEVKVAGAIGSPLATTTRKRLSNVATLAVPGHALVVGIHIYVKGVSGTGYNNRDAIVTNVVGSAVSYANTGSDESVVADTGGLVQKMSTTGYVTENWDKAEADTDSLCALLGGERLDDICRKCDLVPVLIGASSVDWCLKQFTRVFYRERCTNPGAVGTVVTNGYEAAIGAYVQDGYDSILRWAPLQIKGSAVQLDSFQLDYISAPQTPASMIGLRVGISAQPGDPNTGECRIVWHQHSEKELKCLSPSTAEMHLINNTQPSETLMWPFLRSGRFLYVEMKLTGIGGEAAFSGVIGEAKRIPIKNF